MTRLTSHAFAVFAAIAITATTFASIVTVPPAHAFAAMHTLA